MKCVECGETGAGDCPEFNKIMCDDCYTVERDRDWETKMLP